MGIVPKYSGLSKYQDLFWKNLHNFSIKSPQLIPLPYQYRMQRKSGGTGMFVDIKNHMRIALTGQKQRKREWQSSCHSSCQLQKTNYIFTLWGCPGSF